MAAEEKKPKIDLKARLGRGAAGGGTPAGLPTGSSFSSMPPPQVGSASPPAGGSIPPPQVGAVPRGMAPVAGGVPAPPFGGPPAETTDAFGQRVAASPVRAVPTTFKIELDAETVAAAQKGGKRATILSAITLLIGLGVGFAWGGSSASNKGANAALQGAQELIGEIDQSQGKIKEMADKIGAAVKGMKEKKFPDSFANDLGGLSIPFGPDKLAGRNIGRFDPRTLSMLFGYASDVDALNSRKDALKNLFSGQKKAIQDALGAGSNPKVAWTVFVQKSPAHGPVGVIAAINPTDAFAYKDAKWPEAFKISTGRELVQTDRFQGGAKESIFSTEKKVVAIPLDPDSVTTSFPTDILGRITSELAKTEGIMTGSGAPGEEAEQGILKKGEQLLIALRKIGAK
ncbi:MAG TPA: hypothetical protein VK540_28655 [Polyangiaceae bacterium]|nr:hypothetical protein [Polyangiaceae bacterium]